MKRMRLICAILLLAGTHGFAAQQADLAIANRLTLTTAQDGFDGRLELLEDARLTPDLQKVLWGSGGVEMALDAGDPRYTMLTSTPLRNAVLRLRDAHGKMVAETGLRRELARMRFERLHAGQRTILVTTDLSAGFGSYSGPLTELFEVTGGGLKPVLARNAESELSEPIRLASTLKSAWKLTEAAGGRGGQKDILEIVCRPDLDERETKFFVTYSRYHWDGKGWIVLRRKVRGFWDGDQAFPMEKRFP